MFIRSLFIALAIGLAAGATTAHARPQAQRAHHEAVDRGERRQHAEGES